MDASQRVILSATRVVDGHERRIVCAEPSPDSLRAVAQSLSNSLNASVPLNVNGQTVTPTVSDQVATTLAESAAYVGVRNATIQLLRDALYRACEAYLNGVIDDTGYALILTNYPRISAALLTAEGLTRPTFAPPVIINTSATAGAQEKAATGESKGSSTASTVTVQSPTSMSQEQIEALRDLLNPWVNPHQNGQGDVAIACLMQMSRISRGDVKLTGTTLTKEMNDTCQLAIASYLAHGSTATPISMPHPSAAGAGVKPASLQTAALR